MADATEQERRAERRLRRLVWTLTDQGIASLGTFLVSLLLARELAPGDFGIFTLIFGTSLLLYSLHSSLVIYPLTVKAATAEETELRRLLGLALVASAGLAVPILLGLGGLTVALDRPWLAFPVAGAAAAWLFQETARRVLMARLRLAGVVPGDAISYLGQFLGVWLLSQSDRLSLESTFVVMAGSSLVAGAVQTIQVGLAGFDVGQLKNAARAGWALGRWALPASLVGALTVQAFPWLLAISHGTVATARFQAAVNLLGATNPVMYGVGNILVPLVGRARQSSGSRGAQAALRQYALIGGLVLLPYFTALLGWPGLALRLLYGGDSTYRSLELAVRLLVVGFGLIYLAHLLGATLYGLERSRAALATQLASAVAILLVGIPCTLWLGVSGAALGVIAAHGTRALAGAWLLARDRSAGTAGRRDRRNVVATRSTVAVAGTGCDPRRPAQRRKGMAQVDPTSGDNRSQVEGRRPRIAIFDYRVVATNPSGSCHLRLVRALCQRYDFTVFSTEFENPCPARVRWVPIRVPRRPLALLFVSFHLLAPVQRWADRLRRRSHFDLTQLVESNLLTGQVSYAHFCHRAYLRHHWQPGQGRSLRGALHWVDHALHALAEPWVFRRVRRVVVPSRGLAGELRAEYPWLDGKVQVIHNPIEAERLRPPDDFDRGEARHTLGIAPEDHVAVFVALGHFQRKGLPALLAAVARLDEPRVRLLVVGGQAGLVAEHRRLAQRLGIERQVIFTGMQRDTRPYLWLADVFVLPSSYEVFPFAALEAAAAGLPLVVTPLYGVEEFMIDQQHGLVVEPTEASLSAALRDLFDRSAAERQALGQRARQSVQRFDVASFTRQWAAVFDSMTEGSRG